MDLGSRLDSRLECLGEGLFDRLLGKEKSAGSYYQAADQVITLTKQLHKTQADLDALVSRKQEIIEALKPYLTAGHSIEKTRLTRAYLEVKNEIGHCTKLLQAIKQQVKLAEVELKKQEQSAAVATPKGDEEDMLYRQLSSESGDQIKESYNPFTRLIRRLRRIR